MATTYMAQHVHVLLSLTTLAAIQLDIVASRRRALVSRRKALFLGSLSLLLLLSWPWPGIGCLGYLFLSHVVVLQRQPRMREFFQGRSSLQERFSDAPRRGWWRASQYLHWRFPTWVSAVDEDDSDDPKLTLLYQVKTFLITLDAIGFMVASSLLTQRYPATGTVFSFLLTISMPVSVLLLFLGLFALFFNSAVQWFRHTRLLDEFIQNALRYLIRGNFTILAGIYIGLLILKGDSKQTSLFLLVIGFFVGLPVFVLDSLPILPRGSGRREVRALWWGAGLLMIGISARQLVLRKLYTDDLMGLLALLGLSSPAFAVFIGLTLGRRLRLPKTAFTPANHVAYLFCRVTSFFPFGGLAVPLWVLLRKLIDTQVGSRLLTKAITPIVEKEITAANIGARLRTREERTYCFSHLLAHLKDSGDRSRIFELLERSSFLKEQVTHFANFVKSSEDVEKYVVTATLEAGDWNRFIQFMLLALHMRGTAEDLVDLVEPLARNGQVELAMSAINRIADPADRCGAKAIVASTLESDSELYQRLARSLPADLSDVSLPADPNIAEAIAERQFWSLFVTAQEFGMNVKDSMMRIIEDRPGLNDAIWCGVAACHAKRGGLLDSCLWEALCAVRDTDTLKKCVSEIIINVEALPEPEHILLMAGALIEDDDFLWLCRFAILGRVAQLCLEEAWELWIAWSTEHTVSWSPGMAEQASPFLRSLNDPQRLQIIKGILDDESRACACVFTLTPQCNLEAFQLAQAHIDRLAPVNIRLRWKLQLLEILSHLISITEEIEEISQILRTQSPDLGADDFRRFLELVALFIPDHLEDEIEQVLYGSECSSEIFMGIAQKSECVPLLTHFLDHLDDYLLPYSIPESGSFQAWRELRKQIIPRLCTLDGKISHLTRAIKDNPEQADGLRVATVKSLLKGNSVDLAEDVCRSISSPSMRHRTRLKLLAKTGKAKNLFEPSSLLESMTIDDWVQDEILSMRSLTASADLPGSLLHVHATQIRDSQQQYLTLVRVALRALGQSRYKVNPRGILERLTQSAGLVISDAQLLAMAPEITEMIATHHGRRCILEIRETLEQLVSIPNIPWLLRRDLVESYLARMLPLLSENIDKGSFWGDAENVAEIFLALMKQVAHGSDLSIEERGLIPILFAVVDRLPVRVMECFARGCEASKFLWLYLRDQDELIDSWDQEMKKHDPDPIFLETILYLLSYLSPEDVPLGIDLLPAIPFRDRVSSNLLRHGWLPVELAPEVLPLIGDATVRLSTEIWLGLSCAPDSEDEEAWLHSLASLSVLSLVETVDSRIEPWFRKLWTINPERSRPILARAALQALANGGHLQGRVSLCLWLQAHLAPDAGRDPAEVLALCTQAEHAVQKALKLVGAPTSTNT